MAEITIQVPPKYPPGTVLQVYPDPGGDLPPSGPVVTTAVVSADSLATIVGLTLRRAYQVGALFGGKWIGMLVEIANIPDRPATGHVIADESDELLDRSELAFEGDAVDADDDGPGDRTRIAVRAQRVYNVKDYGAVGDGVADDTPAFVLARDAAGDGTVFMPKGAYALSAYLVIDTDGQRWKGEGGETFVYQTDYNKQAFRVTAANVTFEDFVLGYPPAYDKDILGLGPDWVDPDPNVMLDTLQTRAAMIYAFGAANLTIRRMGFANVLTGIRARSQDPFTERIVGLRVHDCWMEHFDFGMLLGYLDDCVISRMRTRHTDATSATAPPHAIYMAGNATAPEDIDPSESEGAAPRGLTNLDVHISDWVDYDNPYSSSFKLKNIRGGTVQNMRSVLSSRGIELDYCQDVTVSGVKAHDIVIHHSLIDDSETGDSQAAAVAFTTSSHCKMSDVDVRAKSPFDDFSGVSLRGESVDIELVNCDVAIDYTTVTARSAYRLENVHDCVLRDCGYDLKGFTKPAFRFFGTSSDNLIILPRGKVQNIDTDPPVYFEDATTAGNFALISPRLFNFPCTIDMFQWDASGGANTIRFVADSAVLSTCLSNSAAWDPANVAAGAQITQTIPLVGAALGDPVTVGFNKSLQGMQLTAYVSAGDVVTVVLRNGTAGAIDLAAGTLRVQTWKQ